MQAFNGNYLLLWETIPLYTTSMDVTLQTLLANKELQYF